VEAILMIEVQIALVGITIFLLAGIIICLDYETNKYKKTPEYKAAVEKYNRERANES
jgi:hypothetical protein